MLALGEAWGVGVRDKNRIERGERNEERWRDGRRVDSIL